MSAAFTHDARLAQHVEHVRSSLNGVACQCGRLRCSTEVLDLHFVQTNGLEYHVMGELALVSADSQAPHREAVLFARPHESFPAFAFGAPLAPGFRYATAPEVIEMMLTPGRSSTPRPRMGDTYDAPYGSTWIYDGQGWAP